MRYPTLLVFVDGVGLGSRDPSVNPLCSGVCPHLDDFLTRDAVPTDACLGIPGAPQSATGQTTLLTGVNAAAAVGRHIEGFPTRELRAIVAERNIFTRFIADGRSCTFANAYLVDDVSEVHASTWKSVTTVATLTAFGTVRDRALMEQNQAVCHDLTRESLRARGYGGPLVTPGQSAAHLLDIAGRHDLTLFEHFQTDRAGHCAEMDAARNVLTRLDAFIGALLDGKDDTLRVILVSDHGNIEDIRVRGHTRNPVPFAIVGPDSEVLKQRVKSLVDITPALFELT